MTLGLTFHLTSDLTFDVTFGIIFTVTFHLTFHATSYVTFHVTFHVTFDMTLVTLCAAGTVFSVQPSDETTTLRGSVKLPCAASFDPSKSDIIYTWRFNDHHLDFGIDSKDRRHYDMVTHYNSQVVSMVIGMSDFCPK